MSVQPYRVPLATYRLQFGPHLRFEDARELVGYLEALGVTDAYPSPMFRAREGSSHGYDVVDHSGIHPEFGSEEDFRDFAEELKGRGMGLVMDVVPNHMGVNDEHNVWWQDVLENGMSSIYARYFDIDWDPPEEALKQKVLLPFLGDQFGRVLENQELKLVFEDGLFRVAYYDRRFPVAPRAWVHILRLALEEIGDELDSEHPDRMEIESIMTALDNMPPHTEQDPERIEQRYREKEVTRRRLTSLLEQSPVIREALDRAIVEFNGRAGEPQSFDRFEALLADQPYRLCYWRVAVDEINYRRFFDINELGAIRVEEPEVFEAVHGMIFRFLGNGWVTGLRIDHPDGLLDPQQYFTNLQEAFRALEVEHSSSIDRNGGDDLYVVVEKILAQDENLPAEWPVCGTTGYDFLNLLNGLFVEPHGMQRVRNLYARFIEDWSSFPDVLYESKKTILNVSMSGELHVLAWHLDRISEQHRWSRDFTRTSLRRALREVIACFPVYRTYTRPGAQPVREEDRNRIMTAIRAAKRRNPGMSPSFFDFIASVLLLEHPEGLTEEEIADRLQFVLKFQQVTGPVTAKGLEDTSFYRFYPLASCNEVGGELMHFGTPVETFHRRNMARRADWPFGMLTTSTHDTKRGEDVRARLNVLSEVPEEWDEAIRAWQTLNLGHRREIDGNPVPDANEEYLLYQTLVGTWPLEWEGDESREEYRQRIVAYMDKALKEAKVHTNWLNPDVEYDQAVAGFVEDVLDGEKSAEFLGSVDAFVRTIADAGFHNSLSQVLLKVCCPGMPDFYQGTEFWEFHLVDPDNRRPVDFARRRRVLAEFRDQSGDARALLQQLLGAWPDERLKMFLMWRTLQFRRERPDLFLHGSYIPVECEGARADQVCAFVRERDEQWILVVVPRFTLPAWRQEGLAGSGPERFAQLALWWSETHLLLPPDAPSKWRHVHTGAEFTAEADEVERHRLPVDALLSGFPVALLQSE